MTRSSARLVRPVFRGDLAELANDKLNRGRQVGVTSADDAGLASKAQRVMIDGNYATG